MNDSMMKRLFSLITFRKQISHSRCFITLITAITQLGTLCIDGNVALEDSESSAQLMQQSVSFFNLEKATLLNLSSSRRRSRALSRCATLATIATTDEQQQRVSSWTPPPPAPWTASTCPPCCYLLAFDVQDSSSHRVGTVLEHYTQAHEYEAAEVACFTAAA